MYMSVIVKNISISVLLTDGYNLMYLCLNLYPLWYYGPAVFIY